MKKFLVGLLFFLLFFVLLSDSLVFSRSISEMSLEEIEKELANITAAIGPLKNESADLTSKIVNAQNRIISIEQRVRQLSGEIDERTEDLVYQRAMFEQRVRSQYLKQRSSASPLLTIFAGDSEAADLARGVSFSRVAARKDREDLIVLAEKLVQLKQDKKALERVRQELATVKVAFAKRKEFLEGEIRTAERYRAQLSARQKELLAARSGSFASAVGEVPVSNIPCSGPPGSPSFCDPGGGTWFAAFSFGAWTHRRGMSQYGAKGRAEAGQSYREILKAYYGKEPVERDTSGNILVQGHGSLNFEEDYLLGIAEMPASWREEALRAQAIAARTYAYRFKQSGRAICVTQACQVFSRSKANNPPAAWRKAVEDTRGQIIEDVVTYYSSTAGGFLTTSGWDTRDGQGGEGFASRAWESIAGSPWFYSSWYTRGFNVATGTCGRTHPWLSETEMADILNAWLVLRSHRDDSRILPVTINQCPINNITGNPYSLEEMRTRANDSGGAYTNVSSVSVRYGNDGQTSLVIFQTNRGEVSVPGSEFLEAFNLRAPGFVAIRSPLFNIEKK